MSRTLTTILVLLAWLMSAYTLTSYAGVDIPGKAQIVKESIWVNIGTDGSIASAKDAGFRILGVLRIIISWIALVYLVLIGAYMIIWSDSEETIKTQRKQIFYALIGFLFLNIPSLVYTIFMPGSGGTIGPVGSWSDTSGWFFWNTAGFEWIVGNIIAFLRVFAFGAAVVMFTWWLFALIVSGGDEEKWKKAKNHIIYGMLGLVFMGFVGLWGELVATGDFTSYIPGVAGTIFSLAMYIAAPIAIFMLIWGGYYWITSAWDEERIKKWKSILINTGIAVIILLAALSFMTDLIKFQI